MIVVNLVLFMLLFSLHDCRLPDKVYCVNEQCNEPISKAKTLLAYNSGDKDLMSFRGNAEAQIFMKSAGSNPDLWYALIDGKYGFVSSKFLRENKVFVKNPPFTIPVQVRKKTEVQPDKVQQAHEVVDGTTIYSTEPAGTNKEQTTPQPTPNDQSTPPISAQDPAQNVNTLGENIWNQITAKQPATENPKATNTNEGESVTPPPTSEPHTGSGDGLNMGQPSTDNPVPISPPQTAQTIDIKQNENVEINTNTLPPAQVPETVPLPESLASGELINADVYDVSKKVDVTQETLAQPEPNNNIESNTSNTVNNIETLSLVGTSNVPDSGLNKPDVEVPNVFNQDGNTVNNVNGQVPHMSIPEIQDASVQEKPIEVPQENLPPSTESTPISTESGSALTESTPTSTESGSALTESSPKSTESLPPPTQSTPLYTESVPSFTESTPLYTESLPPITESIALSSENILSSTESTPLSTEGVPKSTESITEGSHEIPNVQDSTEVYSDSTEATWQHQNDESANYWNPSTPAPDIPSNTDNNEDNSNVDQLTTPPPENYNTEENGEGFISSMFSTVSNMWDSTTEKPAVEDSGWEANIAPPPTQDIEEGFSFFSYLFTTYNNIMGTQEQSKALFASPGETCFTDEYCDGSGSTTQGNRLLTLLLTSASTVLVFMLGYYYIENRRQDSKLIGDINSLQRQLLFATKECEILKEELTTTKTKLTGIEDNSFGMDDMVQSLKETIEELKAQNERLRNSLDDNEKLLRVSENTAGELQNTLSDVENTISELLGERANFEEQIAELSSKIQAFEEELMTVSRDRDNYQLKYVSAENAVEESKKYKKQLDELNEKLKEANNVIDLQKHEISALKDALKEVKNGVLSNVDVGSLIDHTEIKAKLAKAQEEKTSFESKYETEHAERSRLSSELQTTKESLRAATQQATEASTRLEVLGKYFQEREAELMKELSAKESLFLSKQGESASTVEKMELLQQEIQRYKEKCDALTLELAEAESSRRAALSEVEARAHGAWLEARAARRDADAARDDAAALRRKLAAMSALTVDSPHRQMSSPLEGVDGALPPPLPLAFLPPPLLPPLPRPPPLGRLPSPHPPRYNDRRYSPDSRYSPESRYSPQSRYSPETVRYSPDSRYSPHRRSPYSPRRRYTDSRGSRSRPPAPPDTEYTETEYHSDSPTRPARDRRRRRYSRHSGPSSGSGCSSESDK